jgi:hypothetical protein
MADALASGASVLRDVGVQVPLRPPRAVLRTAGVKVTNSKGVVTFVFGEVSESVTRKAVFGGLSRASPRVGPIRVIDSLWI